MALSKQERRNKIKRRIRKNLTGTSNVPRLSVFRSNRQISVQIIDDLTGKTLVAASSLEKDIAANKVAKAEQAKLVGEKIAKKSLEKGIQKVVFDRNGYLYHGRLKSLADAARKGGLKF